MLLETVKALYSKLQEINDDESVKSVCKVKVLMAEKYRELIAKQEQTTDEKKLPYPIIVLYDNGSLEYDATRFLNDKVEKGYRVVEKDGDVIYYSDVYEPLLPYNLNYRIEIICDKRIQINTILLWVMKNIPDRYVLQVPYKEIDGTDCIYDALYKRGNIIKADEDTSSTLYRRIFEMKISTLIDGKFDKSYVKVKGIKVNGFTKLYEKGVKENGK